MKSVILSLFILLSSFASITVIAGPTEVKNIGSIRVRHNVAYIRFKGCPEYSKIYLDSDYAKLMLSAALVAGAAGKRAEVQFVDDNGCQEIESNITYLEVIF